MAFYISDQPSEETFGKIVSAALELGSQLTGPALIGDLGRLDSLRVVNQRFVSEEAVSTQVELQKLLEASPRAVYGLRMGGGFQHASDSFFEIQALNVDFAKPGPIRHSIDIATEGEVFDASATRAARRSAARKILTDFMRLIESVRPSYAAFNVEMAMSTPMELAIGDSLSLRDVYLASDYVGSSALEEFRTHASAYPIHELRYGLLVLSGSLGWALTSKESTREDDLYISDAAAELIVSAERHRG